MEEKDALIADVAKVLKANNTADMGARAAALQADIARQKKEIDELNTNQEYTRKTIKDAFASLTIGSGSAAILLVNSGLSRTGNRFRGAIVQANSDGAALCRSQVDVTAGGRASGQTMKTDSETLLHTGVELAADAFTRFEPEFGWNADDLDRIFCHQVGRAHQKLLFETLGLDVTKNFATLPYCGNTGSVALPTAAALGIESGFAREGEKLGLFGIGSGVNVVLAALEWNKTLPSSAPIDRATLDRFLAINQPQS